MMTPAVKVHTAVDSLEKDKKNDASPPAYGIMGTVPPKYDTISMV